MHLFNNLTANFFSIRIVLYKSNLKINTFLILFFFFYIKNPLAEFIK